MYRPATLAELASKLATDPALWDRLLAGFLDTFYMTPARRQLMIDDEPGWLDHPIFDASLGAIAEHLARRWDLTIPAWTEDQRRFLAAPHFPTPLEDLKPLLIAQSPLAFRRRLIFVEHEPLSRARMPRAVATTD